MGPTPTYTKLWVRKSATPDWAHRVGSSSGLITVVAMTLLNYLMHLNIVVRNVAKQWLFWIIVFFFHFQNLCWYISSTWCCGNMSITLLSIKLFIISRQLSVTLSLHYWNLLAFAYFHRNSNTFKSVEEKVGSAYTNVKVNYRFSLVIVCWRDFTCPSPMSWR